MSYCASRFRTIRRPSVEVKVGTVGVGGKNPLRLQSMTTSDTQDIEATVKQSIALAEVGCEIVRITAPNPAAAKCLREIRQKISAAGFGHVPLVADIHFLPQAAMEAVEHVEKVRVNPGNYADKKKFNVREYSDADYERELQRLHDAFSPLVKRAKELGRALRIGTNHGSLSDRVMNRYGDTPLGMVESALEFVRICEAHGFHDIILSMKASNPKIMIQTYRLLAARMDTAHRPYPLHLGVTEAGDGEDGRIKSAIGIGSLLLDGLGDTIRVSLTEDSVYEIPVARAIADKAMALWRDTPGAMTNDQLPMTNGHSSSVIGHSGSSDTDSIDPFTYERRPISEIELAQGCRLGPEQPPRVIVRASLAEMADPSSAIRSPKLIDTPVEGVLVTIATAADLAQAGASLQAAATSPVFVVLELAAAITPAELKSKIEKSKIPLVLLRRFAAGDDALLRDFAAFARDRGHVLACDIAPGDFPPLAAALRSLGDANAIFTLSSPAASAAHAVGAYRQLAGELRQLGSRAPIWIRNTPATAMQGDNSFLSKLLEASFLTGGLLCDGLGDLVSIETEADLVRSTKLAYNVLQGAGARSSKTEFVACPSCGRTLFDLQTTTQRIREKTGHLKGVKIAIMGCIVNGPGEMADADFGYVGGAPGKINLYVGKQCVQYNLPQTGADERLIALIKEHGKWADPAPALAP
ncbi:MAG TPA: (E)-4-hydroxy-3-methylbut-2-enyl-diphosphate synthase [Opitutaceae bacterium]|jgi:(E)-4-hydroxy-3-methylbut-2-enyl-diphosphate synthase|nr:(E)-4-hydroxy-3-methylbut-2-enyl-diphosphate synthase [Opitutaceae bacterium]